MSRLSRSLMVLTAALVFAVPAIAEDLEGLLEQVGEQYATAYIEPLIHGFGANQNSALYHTAKIPRSKLTFSIGLKMMGTKLSEDDQTFRTVFPVDDVQDLFPDSPVSAPGYIVMSGPTVFGDPDTEGTATAYVGGLPVYQIDAIPGLVETTWVPLMTPQFDIGGLFGVRGSLRWLPAYDLDDYGETKFLGYGLSWSPNWLLPDLPVDVAVGFFKQEIDLGTVVETEASSLFITASKGYGPLVVYGGVATESSSLKVEYEFDPDPNVPNDEETIKFDLDGEMGGRFTLGATLDLPLKLNMEMNVGTLTVYSAGIMFGL